MSESEDGIDDSYDSDFPYPHLDPPELNDLKGGTMSIAELLDKLGQTKKASGVLYGQYKELKDQEESLKTELMFMLKDAGAKTFKGNAFSASIAEKPTVVIKDESALIEWLQNTPDVESDFYIGVKKPEFNTLAKQMLKETGELANGTEVEVRESLTIKGNKG